MLAAGMNLHSGLEETGGTFRTVVVTIAATVSVCVAVALTMLRNFLKS
jgi:hypothetical protein